MDYSDNELAVAGTLLHGFEFVFVKVKPIVLVLLMIGIIITYKKNNRLLMNNYISINRHKYYLKVKEIFKDIESNSDFIIDIKETDKDHIHLLVSYPPKISISSIVRKLKQVSTILLWKYFPVFLSKHFWNEHTF